MDRPENEVGKDQDESEPSDNKIGGDNKRPSPESNSGVDERSTSKKVRTQRRIFTPLKKVSRTYTTQTSQRLGYEINLGRQIQIILDQEDMIPRKTGARWSLKSQRKSGGKTQKWTFSGFTGLTGMSRHPTDQ